MSEFDYLLSAQNKEELVGIWIAIVGKEVVAKGDTVKEVFFRAKELHPNKEPFITKLPKNKVMVM